MITAVISIFLSSAALVLSLFTWRESRSKDRRDLYLRLYERLIDHDLMRGRRILSDQIHSAKDVDDLLSRRYSDYEAVSRSLSMLDLAALYVDKGYVDKAMFISEWGPVYLGLRHKFLILTTARAKTDETYLRSWPHFRQLADEVSSATTGRNQL